MKFDDFYLENREKIFFFVLRKLGRKEISEDITSEAFFRLYKHWDSVCTRENGEILAWTYTVSRNLTIDFYKKKKATNLEFEPTSEEEGIMKQIIKEENKQELHQAIKMLPEEKQDLLALRFNQDLKYKEIAEVLDKKEAACKMMLYRALGELKANLAEIRKNG